jgi:hypothetical protein
MWIFMVVWGISALNPLAITAEAEMTITDDSLFAIVTNKEGIAAGLAHDHLISASEFEADLQVDRDTLESTRLTLRFPVSGLQVDNTEAGKKWYPKVSALGMVDEPFSDHSESRARKIRKTMLGKRQLHADDHPVIEAELLSVTAKENEWGGQTFAYMLETRVTVKGKTVTKQFPGNLYFEDGAFRLVAAGSMNFTDFGIKPYSTAFGAMANADQFYLYVDVTAR